MTSNFNLLRYTFGPPKHGQQKGKLVEWRMMGVMNGAWVALAVRQPKVKPILDLREQVTTHRIHNRGSCRLLWRWTQRRTQHSVLSSLVLDSEAPQVWVLC